MYLYTMKWFFSKHSRMSWSQNNIFHSIQCIELYLFDWWLGRAGRTQSLLWFTGQHRIKSFTCFYGNLILWSVIYMMRYHRYYLLYCSCLLTRNWFNQLFSRSHFSLRIRDMDYVMGRFVNNGVITLLRMLIQIFLYMHNLFNHLQSKLP